MKNKKPTMKAISLRLNEKTIEKLKTNALKLGIGYQTLIRIILNKELNK